MLGYANFQHCDLAGNRIGAFPLTPGLTSAFPHECGHIFMQGDRLLGGNGQMLLQVHRKSSLNEHGDPQVIQTLDIIDRRALMEDEDASNLWPTIMRRPTQLGSHVGVVTSEGEDTYAEVKDDRILSVRRVDLYPATSGCRLTVFIAYVADLDYQHRSRSVDEDLRIVTVKELDVLSLASSIFEPGLSSLLVSAEFASLNPEVMTSSRTALAPRLAALLSSRSACQPMSD